MADATAPPTYSDLQNSDAWKGLDELQRNKVRDGWAADAIKYGKENVGGFDESHAKAIITQVNKDSYHIPTPQEVAEKLNQNPESAANLKTLNDFENRGSESYIPGAVPSMDDLKKTHPFIGSFTEGILKNVYGALTPNNAEMALGVEESPAIVQKLVGAGFTAYQAHNAAESLTKAALTSDPKERGALVADGLVNSIFSVLGGVGTTREGSSVISSEDAQAHLKTVPLNILQSGHEMISSDPKFAKTLPYDPQLISDEIVRKKQQTLNATADQIKDVAPLTAQALKQTEPKVGELNEEQNTTGQGNQQTGDAQERATPSEQPAVQADIQTTPARQPQPDQRQSGESSKVLIEKPQEQGKETTNEKENANENEEKDAQKEEVATTGGSTPPVPHKVEPPPELKDTLDGLGARYDGVQEGYKDVPSTHQITLPDTGDTINVPLDATQEQILQRINEKRDVAGKDFAVGAAAPSEFPKAKITSVKNATVDEERVARGQEPLMSAASKEMGATWEDAMNEIEKDSKAGENLVRDVNSGKKTDVSARDQAVLLHERITLQNARDAEIDRINDQNSTNGDRAEARIKFAQLEEQLNDTDEAARKTGTIAGRSLQFRQMMARDDFTPAAMDSRRRASLGDKPLTPEEVDKIRQQSERIQELEKQLAEREAGTKQRASDKAADDSLKDLKAEAGKSKGNVNDAESIQNKIKERIDKGEKIQDMAGLVQRLALDFVRKGIKERNALVDAVHGVLKTIIPDITPRETMDAISGYGEFKQLSKDEIKVQLRDLKGQMQQAAKIEDMQSKIPPKKTGVERRIPSDAERALIREVNELKKKGGFNVTDPETQLKSALQSFKTRTKNRITDLQAKIDAGDFSKKPRRELVLDSEALKLRAEAERVKTEYERENTKNRLANRTPTEKLLDAIPKWSRAGMLSSPTILGKLGTAALYRLAFSPLENLTTGKAIEKIFPALAERAPREGNSSARIEAKALTTGIMKGIQDAKDTLSPSKNYQSDLDATYGKRNVAPPELKDWFGHLHGALKAVTKRTAFERSILQQSEHYIRNGVDVHDPFIQMKMGVDAYKEANRSIFMQDNRLVSAVKAGIGTLERPDKETGKTPIGSKIAAAAIKTTLPIIKVPTNIVGEVMQYAVGSVTGSTRLAKAYRAGIENIKPAEADLVMRELKKGSLGGALLLLGYFGYKSVGGYYQQGEKRDKDAPKPSSAKVFDTQIPSYLLHAPQLEILQMGATVRRVAESRLKKTDKDPQGIPTGVLAAGLGLTNEVPFVRETVDIGKLFNADERSKVIGEFAKARVDPQFVQFIANQMDKDKPFNPSSETTKRDPQTVMQTIESGIPVLRQDVPEKKKKKLGRGGR